MNINWKSEATWTAIGGGLVAILTGTGILVGDEGAAATAVIANITAGVIGLVMLIRGVRDRINADEDEG